MQAGFSGRFGIAQLLARLHGNPYGLPKKDVMSKQIVFEEPSAVRMRIVSSCRPSFCDKSCETMREPACFVKTHHRSARTPSVS